jgi:NAD(P)H-quinone oxidoreductase subunit 5
VFYGALSVHLGAFLLLRVGPILDASWPLSIIVVVVGVSTAVLAALAEKAQSDIKSSLSFASLCQVGIIVAEIGCGLRYIALIHLLGHACLRTLQFVRAPTILLDVRSMENALGSRLPHPSADSARGLKRRFGNWLYRFALERGYLDALLNRFIVNPFISIFRWCDAAERRWTDFLARNHSRESDDLEPAVTPFEDLL